MPYRLKSIVAEARRRGAEVREGGKHSKLCLPGAPRPFTIPRGKKELDDWWIREICKWGRWEREEFVAEL